VREEMRRTRRRFGARSMRKTSAGLDPTGAWVDERDPRFLDLYLEGYRWLLERAPDARRRLLRDQVPPARGVRRE
jgi:hypothetical protein